MRLYSVKIIFWILPLLVLISCSSPDATSTITLSGKVAFHGSEEWFLLAEPIHYKYGEPDRIPLEVSENGTFSLQLNPREERRLPQAEESKYWFYELHTTDKSYPLFFESGKSYQLNIDRLKFPLALSSPDESYPADWISKYEQFLSLRDSLNGLIGEQLDDFRSGKETQVADLRRQNMLQAQELFADTPLKRIYHKTVGEYLVARIDELRYLQIWKEPKDRASNARKKVLDEADSLEFFSYRGLKAQRAGIRDLAYAYALTFGIQAQLREEYGEQLLIYDIQRMAYTKFDSARTSLLTYIEQRKALAYARMYLVAERMGDISFQKSKPSYEEFQREFNDFPVFQSFLKRMYESRKAVSRGNPAIGFSFPDADGNVRKLKEFRGKYVLLDFWASWCQPCLDEFVHLRELYPKYPKSKFEIVSISIEKDSTRWQQAIQRLENPWPQLYAGEGFENETFKAYMGGGIPFYILVAPDGTIARYNDIHASFNLDTVLTRLINHP